MAAKLSLQSNLEFTALHLQFLLRFVVPFSPSDGCERVIYNECSECMFCVNVLSVTSDLNIYNWSTRSHPSKGENHTLEIAAKNASVFKQETINF